jgi:hypothetical protein
VVPFKDLKGLTIREKSVPYAIRFWTVVLSVRRSPITIPEKALGNAKADPGGAGARELRPQFDVRSVG